MKVWQAVALVSIPALALVLAVLGDRSDRHASAGDGAATAGFDLDPSGNSADSPGTIETCLQVAPGSTISIRTWVNGVPSNRTLAGFSYNLVFGAGASVSTHDHEHLLAVNPGSMVTDVSEAVPDATSPHSVGALEAAGYPPVGEVGGVLGAYSVAIDAGASGYIALSLDLFALSDTSAEEISPTTFGATLAVAPLTCDGITPQVTPPINPTNCVTWTGTPTVTPSPDPTPPWMPSTSRLFCNDTGLAMSDLHVLFARPQAYDSEMSIVNAPGCPAPYLYPPFPDPPGYLSVNIVWGDACVNPGEWVHMGLTIDCETPAAGCHKPAVVCFYWTLHELPVPAQSPAPNPPTCPSPTSLPTPTASPPTLTPTPICAAGPDPSGGCLPCPTAQPLVAAAAVVLSTCPPIITPTPTPTPTKVIPTPPCPAGTYPSGDCLPCPTAQALVAAGAVILSTCPPIVTPTPTASPLTDVQGDSNCDGGINAADALAVLRMNAGLAVVVPPTCTGFDGDVDCSLSTNAVDSLKILRHNAVLSVTQNEPCPDIGTVE